MTAFELSHSSEFRIQPLQGPVSGDTIPIAAQSGHVPRMLLREENLAEIREIGGPSGCHDFEPAHHVGKRQSGRRGNSPWLPCGNPWLLFSQIRAATGGAPTITTIPSIWFWHYDRISNSIYRISGKSRTSPGVVGVQKAAKFASVPNAEIRNL